MTELTGFDQFWAVYPRRREKFRAKTAYDKALKHATHEEIMRGVAKYASERMGKDQQYTKHPATWLHAGCWTDYDGIASVVAAIALGQPLYFKCPVCWGETIGSGECAHCRKACCG